MKFFIQASFTIITLFCANIAAQNCEKSPPAFFSPDVFSGEKRSGITFSPDGKLALIEEFSSFDPQTNKYTILLSELKTGIWTKPVVASFSGVYSDSKPSFSADGKKVFFASNRPFGDEKKTDFDLWMVERKDKIWSKPVHLGDKINSDKDDLAPSSAKDGTLYFSSFRTGGSGSLDLYESEFVDGEYQTPQAVGALNTKSVENLPFVAADESFLIFEASGRQENIGSPAGDLYLSCRKNGKWQTPQNLGEPINSPRSDRAAFYSEKNGKLYFVSNREASGLAFYQADFKRFVKCFCK